jgi:hypothetical protein
MPITRQSIRHLTRVAALGCALGGAGTSWAAAPAACSVQSGPNLTPVLELYTSEGCSSCPPADKWLSGLKPAAAEGKVVVQAFHVGYWDDIGWVDRFASPAHTARQREIAAANGLRNIYTPQLAQRAGLAGLRRGPERQAGTREGDHQAGADGAGCARGAGDAAGVRRKVVGLLDRDGKRAQQQGEVGRERGGVPAARFCGAAVCAGWGV